MKKSVMTLALVAGSVVPSFAQASVIADWAAAPNGASIAASNLASNISGIALTRGAGVALATGSTFNSLGWNDGSSLSTALAAGNFLQFGVTVGSGFSLNLTNIEFRYDRSGTGPSQAALIVSTDNFTTFSTVFTDTSVSDVGEDNLVALGLTGLTGNVLFRIVAWNASSANGTFDIETINFAGGGTYGIRLNGSVIPTPGSLALLGLGGLVAARRRRA